MASIGGDRLLQQRHGRPPLASQHSNSVPSTPHQHPRDIRFPSRSPSPSRGLGIPSPRSAVSAAPSHGQKGVPLVCKFEAGAEIRKRRIPYKEGGNEPLPAPAQERKKALEPHEDDKLSGDMRELYDRLLPSEESDARRSKLVKKLDDILNKEWPDNDIKANVFGSSGNMLSSNDSDVDICITTPLKKLESMHGLATVLHEYGMEKVVCRASAKVPIVKFWDPELQLACDMNVNNPLALENTRMIKTYVQLDQRVRPLAKIIKYWTKRRILNDAAFGGTISSYTWICMVINFLQTRRPSVLPSLQKLPECQRSQIDGQKSQFADDMERIRGCGAANNESLGKLLFGFFRYYGYEMDYQECVISVKEGRVLSRKEKGWDATNYHDKEARSRLCVEEPFNTYRNLGNSADDYAFSGIHQEIRRAFDLIAEGKLDICCEQYEFPPEEKTIFQRPAPKPKPVLTRSASQSGRSHANSLGAKSSATHPRNSRNTSSQRNNNRRASSGAAFGNHRIPLVQSPTVVVNSNDYFSTTGISTDQLHEQLYKQYQFLQAQQEALRSQLLQQQNAQLQAQAQAHGQPALRNLDLPAASPRQRHFAHSLPTSRMLEHPPNTAPLLPGYLYHYPARYPAPSSPLSMTRSQDGTPSSPSVPANMTPNRRGTQRSTISDSSSSASVRSQSQPGRSFPNPVTLQSMAHPGYDVSGAIAMPSYPFYRPVQYLSQQQGATEHGAHVNLGPAGGSIDPAMPKEYVGYYVGQSPQLGPQYNLGAAHVPIIGDVPQHHRRLSPERPPTVLANGLRRISRSPSPLSHARSPSVSSNAQSAPLPQKPFTDVRQTSRASEEGPVIVNGSTIVAASPRQQVPHAAAPSIPQANDAQVNLGPGPLASHISHTSALEKRQAHAIPSIDTRTQQQPLSKDTPNGIHDGHKGSNEHTTQVNGKPLTTVRNFVNECATQPSPDPSPSLRARAPPKLELSPKIESSKEPTIVPSNPAGDVSSMVLAPLLSPVAELRTPSPTSSRGLVSPQRQTDSSARTAQVKNGRLAENGAEVPHMRPFTETVIANGTTRLDFIWGKPQASHKQLEQKPAVVASPLNATNSVDHSGQWQQATRKGHKKGKSTGLAKVNGNVKASGEPLPANEADRKGG